MDAMASQISRSRSFDQLFIQAQRYGPLWGESTGDWTSYFTVLSLYVAHSMTLYQAEDHLLKWDIPTLWEITLDRSVSF